MVEKKHLDVGNLTGEKNKLFIEYGAGRAGLSSFAAEKLKEHIQDDKSKEKSIKFMIIDRDTRRRKLDKTFRDEFETFREKMDIADFNLEAFISHLQEEGKLVKQNELYCIAKHLCGGATDLSLCSILER